MADKIYYIEDDPDIASGVGEFLEKRGFGVLLERTVWGAKMLLEKQQPSLLLVDWNFPDGSGESLCQWAREKWPGLPVMFLTVRGDTKDIVNGFHNGADDYLVKPFELEVLHARICALLRRTGKAESAKVACDRILVDKERMQVFLGGAEIVVSSLEYQLLVLLMENKNRTLTRNHLLEMFWDSNGNYVNDNTLTVTMKRLREKLEKPSCIKTVRGFGYRMEDTGE